MAVPAHDERDFEFAKKFGLDIEFTILPKKLVDKLCNATNDFQYSRKDGTILESNI